MIQKRHIQHFSYAFSILILLYALANEKPVVAVLQVSWYLTAYGAYYYFIIRAKEMKGN